MRHTVSVLLTKRFNHGDSRNVYGRDGSLPLKDLTQAEIFMQEQRSYQRSSSQALVEISHPGFGMIELKAKDLSDGGVFVVLGNHIAPPVGTVVKARIKRHTGVINQEPVEMQVMHHNGGGFGLMFL